MIRQNESDTVFHKRILSRSLAHGDKRLEAMEAAVSAAVGVRVAAHPTLLYVASYDNLDTMVSQGTYMVDFERIVAIDHSSNNKRR